MKAIRKTTVHFVAALIASAIPLIASAQIVDVVNIGLRGIAHVLEGRKAAPPQAAPAQVSAADRATIEKQVDEAVKNLPPEEREIRRAEMLKQIDQAQSQATNMARAAQAFEQSQQPAGMNIGTIGKILGGSTTGIMRQAEVMAGANGQRAAAVMRSVSVTTPSQPSVIVHKLDSGSADKAPAVEGQAADAKPTQKEQEKPEEIPAGS